MVPALPLNPTDTDRDKFFLYFSKNLIGSTRGRYFPQKCHLWVKKYKSSNIMVIFKGDTFEKKVSPSVTKCHLWPKKVKLSVIMTILKGDTFFEVKIWTLILIKSYRKTKENNGVTISPVYGLVCLLINYTFFLVIEKSQRKHKG